MKKLLGFFSLLIFLNLVGCGSAIKFEKNAIRANWGTSPEKMRTMSEAKQRSTSANFGEAVVALIDSFNRTPEKYAGRETVILGLAEIFGDKITKPGEKVEKRVYNNGGQSIAVGLSTNTGNHASAATPAAQPPPGFTKKGDWFYWDEQDPEHRRKLALSDAELLYSDPDGIYARTLKKILADEYGNK